MFNAIVHGMGRLMAYFYEVVPNYGLAIILLTVAVRLAMIPLAVKQAHVMAANRGNQEKIRKLAPEVKKIKEKYKDDRARQYEEQKKLYDQHGINMLGGLSGCLPMLLQAPIFAAMYQVLSGCNKLFGSGRRCVPGFHIPDASELHAAIVSGRATFLTMNLNLHPTEVYRVAGLVEAIPYYLLVALMGYTMWYQMKQMAKAQPVDPQFAQTQKIMQVMPLVIVIASLNFPVGLTVYWTASNIWTIAQQYFLMKRLGIEAPAAGTAKKSEAPGLFKTLLAGPKVAEKREGASTDDAPKEPKSGKGRERAPQREGARPKGEKGKVGNTRGASSRSRPGREPRGDQDGERAQRGAANSAKERVRKSDGARPATEAVKEGAADSSKRGSAAGARPATGASRGSSSSRPAAKSGRGGGKAKSGARRKGKGGRR
ncbi:MAG: membrane protein insertase YidC [Actinomycetota bacterium]|nr:membrane protein insertase YidC [Actinomycetota bacterium]